MRLSGSDTLSSGLISNGTTFPAGTSVHTDIQLDWYRVGYEYRFAYKYNRASVLSFYPAAGVGIFNFDYKLNGTGALSAARNFEKASELKTPPETENGPSGVHSDLNPS